MKHPTKLRIGAYTYQVKMDPKLSEVANVLGTCLSDSLIILVDHNLPDELEAETLLHEALHAIWHQTSLAKKYNDEEEEYIVWQISPHIFRMLRENPRLVEWLTQAGR